MPTKLSRRDSEARKQAVLEYFLRHPAATGDEVQALLKTGKLTGTPGPTLSTGMLYELRRRAAEMLKTGNVSGRAVHEASGSDLAELRERARALQETIARLPGVAEVVVTRDGARVVRLQPTEEPL